jgi:hypothetical protein
VVSGAGRHDNDEAMIANAPATERYRGAIMVAECSGGWAG